MIQTMSQTLIPSLTEMSARSMILEHPEQIALLHNNKYRNLIRFFMQNPNTIKAAAKASSQTVKRTFNYVQKLLESGFLEVAYSEARGGKAIKYYQATAEDYFVPFIHTKALGYADLIEQELRPLQSQMLQAFEHLLAQRNPLEWGTRLFRDPSGFTHISFTPRKDW